MGHNWVGQEPSRAVDQESVDRKESLEQAQPPRESVDQLMATLERYFETTQGGEAAQSHETETPSPALGTESIEHQILVAIQNYTLSFGKAHTGDIALTVNLSRVQTWRYLKKLAALGSIRRIGERGGWIIVDDDPGSASTN